jgi:glucose-6-phosphate 1-dehydrogenase
VQKHNWLLLGVQPEPFLNLQLTVKQPGLEMLTMQTNLQASFNDESASDAYQELLLDVLEGDQSLFLRWDEVESAWAILDPVIQNWRNRDDAPAFYASGSWGPIPCEGFFHRDDLAWRYDAASKPL